nr:mitochondrial arginine transporter BAC2 [Tanacetum cinerariifolium]
WGKEFVARGFCGSARIMVGYPLDSIRVGNQSSRSGSAFSILRNVMAKEGHLSLYRGMAAPLASVTFQVIFLTFIEAIQEYEGFGSHSDAC